MSTFSAYKLFAEPTFLRGLAKVLDLGNTLDYYNDSDSPTQADVDALREDWEIIGQDMRDALEEIQSNE